MKKIKLVSSSILGLALLSCTSTSTWQGNREPNAKMKSDTLTFTFPELSPEITSKLEVDLVNLPTLLEKKIKFTKVKLQDDRASADIQAWRESLAEFNKDAPDMIEFPTSTFPVRVKKADFKNLALALDLLDKSPEAKDSILRKQAEVLASFSENFKHPLELDVVKIWELGKIGEFFANYHLSQAPSQDIQLPASAIWAPPDIAALNRTLAKENKFVDDMKDIVCVYDGPKRGFGIHQGFRAKCGDKRLKIKFGELTTAPMNSKIYRRLGYNVPVIQYFPEIKINYDRRIFSELNLSKVQKVTIHAVVTKKDMAVRKQNAYDKVVKSALLTDGRTIPAEEFYQKLFPTCYKKAADCNYTASNYNEEFERTVAQLTFVPLSALDEARDHEFGSWDYDDMDHTSRSEIRALLLLGAFTGNHDLRKDNTKLIWTVADNQIKFQISDPGSGFGSGAPMSNSTIQGMPWEILRWSEAKKYGDKSADGPEGKFVEVINYKSNGHHKAFSDVTMGEARWIGRQIAGITEDEITTYMVDSGFSAAELLIAREKLVARQKNIIEILGLQNEFPALMKRQINKQISLESTDQKVTLPLTNGSQIQVETRGDRLIKGNLTTVSRAL